MNVDRYPYPLPRYYSFLTDGFDQILILFLIFNLLLFRFKWVQSGRADGGTVLFSGRVMNVPAIYVEDNRYEFLGNGDWFNKQMEFVVYGSQDFHTVGNFGRHRIFDNNVYVLTKQRCHCQCE